MTPQIGFITAGCTCLISLIGWPATASGDDGVMKRFIGEAQRKWCEYDLLLCGWDVKGEHFVERLGKNAKTSGADAIKEAPTTDRTVFSHDRMQAVNDQGHTIFGSNKEYTFCLARSQGPKAPLSIANVSAPEPNHPSPALTIAASRARGIRFFYPFDFLKVLSSPDFRIRRATEISRGGERLAEVEFEYQLTRPEPKQKHLPKSYIGTVLFAPDKYWAIVEGKMDVGEPRKEVGSYQVTHRLGNACKELPVVVEANDRVYDTAGNLLGNWVSKYEWKEFTGGDDTFTLSAYGFPEPRFQQPSRARLWLVFVSLVLALLGIAVFVYRRGLLRGT